MLKGCIEITQQTPEAFHIADFELRDGELYWKGKSKSLTTGGGNLRSVGAITEILVKEGLHNLGFDIPRGELTTQQTVMLNRVEEELPSASDVAKVDDIELQEVTESAARSMEDFIMASQLKKNVTHAQTPRPGQGTKGH